jgi:hypothetical protein
MKSLEFQIFEICKILTLNVSEFRRSTIKQIFYLCNLKKKFFYGNYFRYQNRFDIEN